MESVMPDMKKRYITEEGTIRTLEEIMRLCSQAGNQADDPALALWCLGHIPRTVSRTLQSTQQNSGPEISG